MGTDGQFLAAMLVLVVVVILVIGGYRIGFNHGQQTVANGTYECEEVQKQWFCARVVKENTGP